MNVTRGIEAGSGLELRSPMPHWAMTKSPATLGPNDPERTGSCLISEAKQGQAWLVLGWETMSPANQLKERQSGIAVVCVHVLVCEGWGSAWDPTISGTGGWLL